MERVTTRWWSPSSCRIASESAVSEEELDYATYQAAIASLEVDRQEVLAADSHKPADLLI